jgi:hypothetical protein
MGGQFHAPAALFRGKDNLKARYGPQADLHVGA